MAIAYQSASNLPGATLFPPQDIPEVATLHDNVTGTTYRFPFNINTLEWSYQLNTQSYSTIGGRVTQILSVRINTMSIQGEAGTRANLMQMFSDYKAMQNSQNQAKRPMTFSVPSRNLVWHVWLENFQMGWGVTTVAYPYVIYFEVFQDISGAATNASTADALSRIININKGNIGFSGDWTGLSTSSHNVQYTDILNAINNGTLTPSPATKTTPGS